jgi:hypothetical protein
MMKEAAGGRTILLGDRGAAAIKTKIIRAQAPGGAQATNFRSESYWVLTSDASDASRGASPIPVASPSLCATRRWLA